MILISISMKKIKIPCSYRAHLFLPNHMHNH